MTEPPKTAPTQKDSTRKGSTEKVSPEKDPTRADALRPEARTLSSRPTEDGSGARAAGAQSAPRPSKPVERIALAAGAVLLALGAAYAVGRVQTSGRIDEANERAASAASAASRAELELEAAREDARRRIARLEARRQLHLAIMAMEERNFGTAQKHAQTAGARLSESAAEGELEKLAEEVSGYRLVATEDIGAQRQKLLEMAKRLDALLPP